MPIELLMKNTGFSLKKGERQSKKQRQQNVVFFSKKVLSLDKATKLHWWFLEFQVPIIRPWGSFSFLLKGPESNSTVLPPPMQEPWPKQRLKWTSARSTHDGLSHTVWCALILERPTKPISSVQPHAAPSEAAAYVCEGVREGAGPAMEAHLSEKVDRHWATCSASAQGHSGRGVRKEGDTNTPS